MNYFSQKKKIIKHFICLVITMQVTIAFGQNLPVDWNPNPVLHKVDTPFIDESAVILEDVRERQYVQDDKNGMFINISNRRLIKVNDDKGVDMYNKIYVSLNNDDQLIEIKARTIEPDGKVINLSPDKIYDDQEDGRQYKKFALEGVEKGSEVEYMYRIKRSISFFGSEYFQFPTVPCQKASFKLITPAYLMFSVKGYNGFNVSPDTVINDQRIVYGTGHDIIALDDEKYAVVSPYLENVQYKLSYNLNRDKYVRIFTWDQMAKNIYGDYTTCTEKAQKSINSFVKQMNIPSSTNEEEKIVAIEEYIKSSIGIDENAGDDGSDVEKIINTKIANKHGIDKLFVNVMDRLGINYQIVFPSQRDHSRFDKELENYDLAQHIIFYFPDNGNYLEPANKLYRYPYIDPYCAATMGIFLKGTAIGTFKTAIAVFDSITILPYETSATNLEVKIKFNSTMDSLLMHSKQMMLGYSAMAYRPAFNFLDKDQKDEMTRSIINSVGKSDSIQNINVQNTAMSECYKNTPLIIEADITSGELLEKAGKKVLVKIGEVIGTQEQMYQEKPRQLPVLMRYPHSEDRDISFTIPDGYKIRNLNDLNINITDADSSASTMGFISNYTVSGNELHIKLHEFYKSVAYPLSSFENFKKVINASADFNKIILVMEKING
jgi:uncharacterized protein DUF3857